MTGMLFDIPQPQKPAANPTPELANAPFQHSVVDSKKGPEEVIANYIGGSNFLCDYYSQKFNDKEELKPFDPAQLNVYQQYHKINKLVIKLQGGLSGSDDSASTGRFNITGTAIIPPNPKLIPNYGDALIADIGEGRAGQFSVTSVRKMTHNLASAWEIEFSLERIADEKIVRLLDSKATQVSYYKQDFLITGQNALLTTEEYNASNDLKRWLKVIATQLVNNNFSNQTRTVTLPLQQVITYDPFVMKAISRLITEEDVPQMRHVTMFNCDDYYISQGDDFYTAVINRDPTMMYSVFRNFRTIQTGTMQALAFGNPIRLSGVKRVVVPLINKLDNDNYGGLNKLIADRGDPLQPGIISGGSDDLTGIDGCGCSNKHNPYYKKKQEEIDESRVGDGGFLIPTISNDSYVLSNAFFDKQLIQCTRFERDVWDLLDGKIVDRKHIYEYCEAYPKWGRLEQYYLGPLLISMIKYAILGI